MTAREIVLRTMQRLIEEREKDSIGAKFWQRVLSDERVNRIAENLGTSDEENEIVEMTLALAEADYWAQRAGGDWPVWQNKETKEISTTYTPKGARADWEKIAEFNTAIHDICDLGDEYKKLAMPERFDKYMFEWWQDVAEGYADAIEEIEERQ